MPATKISPDAVQKALLAQAEAAGKLENLAPIAIEVNLVPGVKPTDPDFMYTPSVFLAPVTNPILAALLSQKGATARGRLTWQIGIGEDNPNRAAIVALRDYVAAGCLYAERTAGLSKPKNLFESRPNYPLSQLRDVLQGTQLQDVIPWNRYNLHNPALQARLNAMDTYYHADTPGIPLPGEGTPQQYSLVTLGKAHHSLYAKICTHQLALPADLPNVDLNLRPAGKSPKEPKAISPVDAVAILEWAVECGFYISDPHNLASYMRGLAGHHLIAYPIGGRPAQAAIAVPARMYKNMTPSQRDKMHLQEPRKNAASVPGYADAPAVAGLIASAQTQPLLHPGVVDTAAMAAATTFEDSLLYDYQQDVVGLHQATKIGFVNCLAPGMGKTITTYRGLQVRSRTIERYRALVVVEPVARDQWTKEIDLWFPEAVIIKVGSRKDVDKLHEALETVDGPVVVVTSYALITDIDPPATKADIMATLIESYDRTWAQQPEDQLQLDINSPATPDGELSADLEDEPVAKTTLGQVLISTHWHDLIADEAEPLRSTGSKQATALWQLRAVSDVALALTGTPINKGVDDLGRLISWTRNDKTLFDGVKLSTQFDLETEQGRNDLLSAVGPLMFRRDTSELGDELPTINPIILRLKPTPAEKALASAARDELKRVYTELLEAIALAEELDPGNDQYAQAREALIEARGAWLGGTTLARMAASDPAALAGSLSSGAKLLAGQGLIEAATATAGTKRSAVVKDVTQRISQGERVLIFTEFSTVARGLINDLDAAGVRVGEVLGGGGVKRDRWISEFQAGNLDVLVCTSSGERGLNLQTACVIVHYDLPWTPKGVIQRTGRARRLKSEHEKLTVIFPIMEGTIEEHVVDIVVSRAVEAMNALDTSRGIDASKTDMGLALGGLVTSQKNASKSKNAMMDLTAAIVAK